MHQASRFLCILAVAGLALAAGTPVWGYTPQTITVDGINNEWLLANRVEDDSGDTQHSTLDLLQVYVTNDANRLFIGFGHDKGNWTQIQDGIKISTPTTNGATNDMWGHAISFTGAHTPGFGAYVNYDNNWQEFRTWTGSAWSAPLRAGPGANGMMHSTSFHEISFLLCELGVASGDSLWFEMIVTQDGTTKGPLDVSASDAAQLSTPGGTTFDTAVPIALPMRIPYRVLSAGDSAPPVVDSACKTASGTISVTFDEAVALASAETISNYTLGGTGAFIVDATRRTDQCNVVDLSLGFNIGAQAGLYTVTVQNVRDLANNIIANNGTTNVARFALKDVLFRGCFKFFLLNQGSPPNTFSVEGDFAPLTFTQTCDHLMTDANSDSTYEASLQFCMPKDPDSTFASQPLQWKFMHNCTTFEPLPSNRQHFLTNKTGARDTIKVFWGDQDPSNFLSHPVDVLFQVDMAAVFNAGDVVTMAGNASPLSFTLPSSIQLRDDGLVGDITAADKVYTRRLRFAFGTSKSVDYKFVLNNMFECADTTVTQGNRNVFVNDAVFDTLSGALGQLVLPPVSWNFCTITDAAVKVIWQLKTNPNTWPGTHVTSVAVRGAAAPLSWDTSLALLDNGVSPDAAPNDGTYSGTGTFALGSPLNVDWKYYINDTFENGFNRNVFLNTEVHSIANPIVLCDTLDVDVTVDAAPAATRGLVLHQNQPNPFNPVTRIVYELPHAGRYQLRVYDLAGRMVRSLVDGDLPAGPGQVLWDGLDVAGRRSGSGLYFYVLQDASGSRVTRKMLLLK